MKQPSSLRDLSRRALERIADPLSVADKIAAFYQRLEAGHYAGLRLFLQHAYRLGLVFARDKKQFRRLQDSEFCRASGQKLTAGNVMRSTLFYVMRATSLSYAVAPENTPRYSRFFTSGPSRRTTSRN